MYPSLFSFLYYLFNVTQTLLLIKIEREKNKKNKINAIRLNPYIVFHCILTAASRLPSAKSIFPVRPRSIWLYPHFLRSNYNFNSFFHNSFRLSMQKRIFGARDIYIFFLAHTNESANEFGFCFDTFKFINYEIF